MLLDEVRSSDFLVYSSILDENIIKQIEKHIRFAKCLEAVA